MNQVYFSNKEELIDVAEEKSCNYWASKLGVSNVVLKSAIRATRSVALKEVQKYLRRMPLIH